MGSGPWDPKDLGQDRATTLLLSLHKNRHGNQMLQKLSYSFKCDHRCVI